MADDSAAATATTPAPQPRSVAATKPLSPRSELAISVPIRHDVRIDWSDYPSNAIGNFGGRLASTYMANSRHADITFHIAADGIDIPAHSLIIGTASVEFEHLCYGKNGSDRVAADTRIEVPADCCGLTDFLVVLRYLYSGGPTVAELTENNAIPIAKLAKHFQLHHLSGQCLALLGGILQPQNVCRLYSALHPMCNAFMERCLQLMQSHFEQILADDTAMRMNDEALYTLFVSKSAFRPPSPMRVLEALGRWANVECDLQELHVSGANRRYVSDGMRFKLVKFTELSYIEFANALCDIGMDFLSVGEIGEIIKRILMRHPSRISESELVIGCTCGHTAAPPPPPSGKKKGNKGHSEPHRTGTSCCFENNRLQYAVPPPPPRLD